MSFDDFAGRVGETFDVSADGGPAVRTELVEATESTEAGGAGPEGQPRLQFSLVFLGPAEPLLPQSTYAIDHDQLGRLLMFLVPIGRDDQGTRYQAVFA
jgi:hypothetical protein